MSVRSPGPCCGILVLALVLTSNVWKAAAQEVDAQDAARDFNAAAELQNSGLHARAAERWSAWLQKYPNDARLDRARYYLGLCKLHAEDYPAAIGLLRELLQKSPQFAQADGARLNLGMALFHVAQGSKEAEEFKAAAAALGEVAAQHPQSPHVAKALYFQGECLYAAGDLPGACEAYQTLIQKHAGSPLLADSYYALGTTRQELGQQTEAVAAFQAFLGKGELAQHELVPEIRLRLGMALAAEGKHAEAEPHFEAAASVAGFAHADLALLRRAQCRLDAGKPAEAAPLFLEAARKFPQSEQKKAAQLGAGKAHFLAEQLDQAQSQLQPLATAGQPESPEAAYWLGRLLLKREKPQEALAVLDPAVRAPTVGDLAPYLELTRADALHALVDRRQEAGTVYEEFPRKYPDHPLAGQARYRCALAALDRRDYATAQKQAEAFLADARFAQHEFRAAVLHLAGEAYLLPLDTPQGGGDLAKAEQFYRQLVAEHPQYPRAGQAQVRIAWCLHRAERYQDSLNHLQAIQGSLSEPELKAEAALLAGRNHAALGQHAQASGAMAAALQARPDWPRKDEALLAWAVSLQQEGNATEAAARLQRLLKEHPQSEYKPQALWQLGEMALAAGKPDEALGHFNQVLQQHADSQYAAPARYGVALAQFRKRDYAAALTPLTALLASGKDSEAVVRGYYLRGLVYQQQGQPDAAAADLQTFLKSRSEGDEAVEARGSLVLCQIAGKKYAEAAAALETLVREQPQYERADDIYYELGHALLAEKKAAEAADAFGKLVRARPESPLAAEAWFQVARFQEEAAVAAGDDKSRRNAALDEAAKAYTAGVAAAKEPEIKEKIQYKLGELQFGRQQFDPAAQTLLAQIAEHPQGTLASAARLLAAESLFRQDKFDQALPLYSQVAADKAEPYVAQALYRAGACAARLEKWPESQKAYETLIRQYAQFELLGDARYGLGLALQRQGKLAEARAAYEQLARTDDTETGAKSRFMMGEIDFVEKRHEDALEQFLTVASGYPYAEWQALARFEAGRCLIELDLKDKAIAALEAFIAQYPQHEKLKDAQRLLTELKK